MDMAADNSFHSEYSETYPPEDAVVEEIEEDESLALTLGRPYLSRPSFSPIKDNNESDPSTFPGLMNLDPCSPKKAREFGNISPISELLDNEDDIEGELNEDGIVTNLAAELDESRGNVTPEPGIHPFRTSYSRISDGRSSPILSYSPSLIKSPSSSGHKPRATATSPSSSSGGGGVGKRPRNIARMLDNISDHSSGEDEVNNVGVMMTKFTV